MSKVGLNGLAERVQHHSVAEAVRSQKYSIK